MDAGPLLVPFLYLWVARVLLQSNITVSAKVTKETGDVYHFAFDGEGAVRHAILYCTVVVKSDESKASGSSGLLIHHQSSIKNSSKLLKVLFEFLLDNVLSNPADKDL